MPSCMYVRLCMNEWMYACMPRKSCYDSCACALVGFMNTPHRHTRIRSAISVYLCELYDSLFSGAHRASTEASGERHGSGSHPPKH
jgi:hypothetical protein